MVAPQYAEDLIAPFLAAWDNQEAYEAARGALLGSNERDAEQKRANFEHLQKDALGEVMRLQDLTSALPARNVKGAVLKIGIALIRLENIISGLSPEQQEALEARFDEVELLLQSAAQAISVEINDEDAERMLAIYGV